jgi:acetyl-CoA/propionyl-CoA carboxylase carboxyl transferase subunit
MGGAMGDVGCRVVVDAYHRAMTESVPIIGLWHSGGARLAEGVLSLHAVGRIFHVMTQASGKIPQVSVVLGPAAGGAAVRPGAHRRGHPRSRRPDLRDRPRRRPLGHR